eukprot:1352514-Amphidinium_carterae.1
MMLYCESDRPPYLGGGVVEGGFPSSVMSWCVSSPAWVVAVLAAQVLALEPLPARSMTTLEGEPGLSLPAWSVIMEGEPGWSLQACSSAAWAPQTESRPNLAVCALLRCHGASIRPRRHCGPVDDGHRGEDQSERTLATDDEAATEDEAVWGSGSLWRWQNFLRACQGKR